MRVDDRGAERPVRASRHDDEVGLERRPLVLVVLVGDPQRRRRGAARVPIPGDEARPGELRLDDRALPVVEVDREQSRPRPRTGGRRSAAGRRRSRSFVAARSFARSCDRHGLGRRRLLLDAREGVARRAGRVQDLDPELVELLLDPLGRGRLDRRDDAVDPQERGASDADARPGPRRARPRADGRTTPCPTPSRTELMIRWAVARDVARVRRDRRDLGLRADVLPDRRDPRAARPPWSAGPRRSRSTSAACSAARPSSRAFSRFVSAAPASASSGAPSASSASSRASVRARRSGLAVRSGVGMLGSASTNSNTAGIELRVPLEDHRRPHDRRADAVLPVVRALALQLVLDRRERLAVEQRQVAHDRVERVVGRDAVRQGLADHPADDLGDVRRVLRRPLRVEDLGARAVPAGRDRLLGEDDADVGVGLDRLRVDPLDRPRAERQRLVLAEDVRDRPRAEARPLLLDRADELGRAWRRSPCPAPGRRAPAAPRARPRRPSTPPSAPRTTRVALTASRSSVVENVPFSSGWSRPISSLTRPDARTRSMSTTTFG